MPLKPREQDIELKSKTETYKKSEELKSFKSAIATGELLPGKNAAESVKSLADNLVASPLTIRAADGNDEAKRYLVSLRNAAVRDLAVNITDTAARIGKAADQIILSDTDIDAAINNLSKDRAINHSELSILRKEIRDTIFGLGPIEDLMKDANVTEIMVNAPNKVFIERMGRIEKTNVAFDDDEHVKRVIDKIVSPLGRHIDESSPLVDARLPDGSRVNAVIPPITINGCALTIRKFSKAPKSIDTLINYGTLSENMARFLEAAVRGRMNILISGGTGSGKTTLLNVLSSFIPEDERIITIEDAAELNLVQEHVVRLEARPANIEGKGAITIRDMVRNSLRMRPDRIIVGEVRGEEALDMLQAMNTGHDGSLTTAHANSPKDAMARIETMAMMAPGIDMPAIAIRQQCASAFNLIVQQQRFKDGSRKIVKISEVTGMADKVILLSDIFKYAPPKDKPNHAPRHTGCGLRPVLCDKLELNGVRVDNKWFDEVTDR